MSRSRPDVAEQRLQVLEILSERLQRLDELVRELKGESGKTADKVESVRLTLSNMQGANINEQVKENKLIITDLEKRVRAQEDFKSNLMGRMTVLVFIASAIAAILTGLAVKIIGR